VIDHGRAFGLFGFWILDFGFWIDPAKSTAWLFTGMHRMDRIGMEKQPFPLLHPVHLVHPYEWSPAVFVGPIQNPKSKIQNRNTAAGLRRIHTGLPPDISAAPRQRGPVMHR
jgi:hypothetical protein